MLEKIKNCPICNRKMEKGSFYYEKYPDSKFETICCPWHLYIRYRDGKPVRFKFYNEYLIESENEVIELTTCHTRLENNCIYYKDKFLLPESFAYNDLEKFRKRIMKLGIYS